MGDTHTECETGPVESRRYQNHSSSFFFRSICCPPLVPLHLRSHLFKYLFKSLTAVGTVRLLFLSFCQCAALPLGEMILRLIHFEGIIIFFLKKIELMKWWAMCRYELPAAIHQEIN